MLPGLDTKATTRSPHQDHGDTPGIQARQNYLTGSPPQFSDTHLTTTIKAHKLSFLEGPALLAPTDYSHRGRCCHLYIGPTVVTCLEIRWPPGFWFSGPAPSRYSQPRSGRPATECERGRGLSALAVAPNAD